jgi:hypothetical protein
MRIPPVHIRPLMVAIFHHYAFNHARAPEFIAGTKVAAAEVSRRPIGEGFGYQRAFGYCWKDPDARYPRLSFRRRWQVAMSDFEKATRVFDALKVAEGQPAQQALPILNGLVALVQGSGEQSLEVEEARSGAFMAICEVGKALQRGQPADQLWAAAIGATERWMSLSK